MVVVGDLYSLLAMKCILFFMLPLLNFRAVKFKVITFLSSLIGYEKINNVIQKFEI